MADHTLYHIGFSRDNLGANPPTIALLLGDSQRAFQIAKQYLA